MLFTIFNDFEAFKINSKKLQDYSFSDFSEHFARERDPYDPYPREEDLYAPENDPYAPENDPYARKKDDPYSRETDPYAEQREGQKEKDRFAPRGDEQDQDLKEKPCFFRLGL